MRLRLARLAVVAAVVVAASSCDTGPTVSKFGNGIAGGPTGNAPVAPVAPGTPDPNVPFLRLHIPPCAVGMSLAACPTWPPADRTIPVRLVNVGDPILVEAYINDDRGLGGTGRLTLTGYKKIGDPDLGTDQQIERYTTNTWPAGGAKHRNHIDIPGETVLRDTVIRRFITPATPLDTDVGELWVVGVVTDSAGNSYTDSLLVDVVNGPKVVLDLPAPSIVDLPFDKPITLQATMTSQFGLDSLKISIAGPWSARLADTLFFRAPGQFPSGSTGPLLQGGQLTFPATAAAGQQVTINAMAWDANGNPGASATKVVTLRASNNTSPLIEQLVPAKIEIDDSVQVTVASDFSITTVGLIQYNARTGLRIRETTLTYTTPKAAPLIQKLPLDCSAWTAALGGTVTQVVPCSFGLANQGDTIKVVTYAIDNNVPPAGPKTGYSAAPGALTPVTALAAAFKNEAIITYGRTFALPLGRSGIIGDIAVDTTTTSGGVPAPSNVYLSNTSFNLLEVWNGSFSSTVKVGSQPWGMYFDAPVNQLLVANSGGTTISQVSIAVACASGPAPCENPANRIRTRDNILYQVLHSISPTTLLSSISWDGNKTSYSDRPQYLAKSAGARIFYSTRPTLQQTPGTIRWLDQTQPAADSRQIYSYGRASQTATNIFTIVDADSIATASRIPGFAVHDTLIIYDHVKGQSGPYGPIGPGGRYPEDCRPSGAFVSFCVQGVTPNLAAANAIAAGGDVDIVVGLDINSLALTDTTFVAASEDRNWIAFGEGNTTTITGRIMAINDPVGGLVGCALPFSCPRPGFFSPAITVDDIADNASEVITGLALDATGTRLLVHGAKTYAAAVQNPFHLRLDGFFDSFDNGAGVAYPPNAAGLTVGFTATAGGRIEAFDVNHYNKRAEFITSLNLYGPIRASLPFATDPAGVILKLFALNSQGLLVIDLVDTQKLVTP
jgi:hypothetical protein